MSQSAVLPEDVLARLARQKAETLQLMERSRALVSSSKPDQRSFALDRTAVEPPSSMAISTSTIASTPAAPTVSTTTAETSTNSRRSPPRKPMTSSVTSASIRERLLQRARELAAGSAASAAKDSQNEGAAEAVDLGSDSAPPMRERLLQRARELAGGPAPPVQTASTTTTTSSSVTTVPSSVAAASAVPSDAVPERKPSSVSLLDRKKSLQTLGRRGSVMSQEVRRKALEQEAIEQQNLTNMLENVQRMRRLQDQATARERGRLKRLAQMEREGAAIIQKKTSKFAKQKESLESRLVAIQNEITKLESDVARCGEEEQRVEREKNELKAKNERQLQPVKNELERFAGIVEESRRSTNHREIILERERKDIESRINDIRRSIEDEAKECDSMRKRQAQHFAAGERVAAERDTKINALQSELSTFQRKISDKEAELQITRAHAEGSPQANTQRLEHAQQNAERARRMLEAAKQQVETLTAAVQKIEQESTQRQFATEQVISPIAPSPQSVSAGVPADSAEARRQIALLTQRLSNLQDELESKLADHERLQAEFDILRSQEQERVKREDVRAAKTNMYIAMKAAELKRSEAQLEKLRAAPSDARVFVEQLLAERQFHLVEEEESSLLNQWDRQRLEARAEIDDLESRLDEQTRTATQLQAQLDAAAAQRSGDDSTPASIEDRQALLQQQQLLQEREGERLRLQSEKQRRMEQVSTLRRALERERDETLLQQIKSLEEVWQAEVVDEMARVDREIAVARKRLEELVVRVYRTRDTESSLEDKRQRLATAREMAARLREAIAEKRTALKETLLDRDAKIRAIETWKQHHGPQTQQTPEIASPATAADSDALTSALAIDKKQLELVKEMQAAKAEAHRKLSEDWQQKEEAEALRCSSFNQYADTMRANIRRIADELQQAQSRLPYADISLDERADLSESGWSYRSLIAQHRSDAAQRAAQDAQASLAQKQSELAEAHKALSDAHSLFDQAEAEVARLTKARTYLSAGDASGMRRLAEAQQREIQALQMAAEQIEREIRRLSADNERENSARDHQRQELEKIIAERLARSKSGDTARMVEQMQDRLSMLDTQIASLQAAHEQKQAALDDLRRSFDALRSKCDGAIAQYDQRLSTIRQQSLDVQKRIRRKQQEFEQLQADYDKITKQHEAQVAQDRSAIAKQQRQMMVKTEKANAELVSEIEKLRTQTNSLAQDVSPANKRVIQAIEEEIRLLEESQLSVADLSQPISVPKLPLSLLSSQSSSPTVETSQSARKPATALVTSAIQQTSGSQSARVPSVTSSVTPSVSTTLTRASAARSISPYASRRTSPRPQTTARSVSRERVPPTQRSKSVTSARAARAPPASAVPRRTAQAYAAENGHNMSGAAVGRDSLVSNGPPAHFDSVSPIAHRNEASDDESVAESAPLETATTRRESEIDARCPFSPQELDQFTVRLRPLLDGIPVFKKNPSGKKIKLCGQDLPVIDRILTLTADLTRLEIRMPQRKSPEIFLRVDRISEFRPRKQPSDIKPRSEGNVVSFLIKDDRPVDLLVVDLDDHHHLTDAVQLLLTLKKNLHYVRWHLRRK